MSEIKEVTDKQRCNHCMAVQDEANTECEECGKDDALMYPFIPCLQDEYRQNARLIAAAPEMYAALRTFLEDPRFVVSVSGNPEVVPVMIAYAKAALAKARGET